MAILVRDKFQNHAGELPPRRCPGAFDKNPNPHGLKTNPKPAGAVTIGQISLQPKNPENCLMKLSKTCRTHSNAPMILHGL